MSRYIGYIISKAEEGVGEFLLERKFRSNVGVIKSKLVAGCGDVEPGGEDFSWCGRVAGDVGGESMLAVE